MRFDFGTLDRVLQRRTPVILAGLAAVALAVEVLQSVPEAFPGAAAGGDFVLGLSYALLGALIFHFLLVQLPTQRRRAKSYEFARQSLMLLVTVPAVLVKPYELFAEAHQGLDLDVYDRDSLKRVADTGGPAFFNAARTSIVTQVVETAFPRALTELAAAAPYLDEEVTHALSMFPRQEGLTTVLQVRTTGTGTIEPGQDAYIVDTLLVAARSLYAALKEAPSFDASTLFDEVFAGQAPHQVRVSDAAVARPA